MGIVLWFESGLFIIYLWGCCFYRGNYCERKCLCLVVNEVFSEGNVNGVGDNY